MKSCRILHFSEHDEAGGGRVIPIECLVQMHETATPLKFRGTPYPNLHAALHRCIQRHTGRYTEKAPHMVLNKSGDYDFLHKWKFS